MPGAGAAVGSHPEHRVGVDGVDGVVPGAARSVGLDGQRPELCAGNGQPEWVAAGVQFGFHAQPGAGTGRGDGRHDNLVAGQRPAPPVHRDLGEQPVFDFVPLRRARREVTDHDCQARFRGQYGQFGFPQPVAVVVGSSGVSGDQ